MRAETGGVPFSLSSGKAGWLLCRMLVMKRPRGSLAPRRRKAQHRSAQKDRDTGKYHGTAMPYCPDGRAVTMCLTSATSASLSLLIQRKANDKRVFCVVLAVVSCCVVNPVLGGEGGWFGIVVCDIFDVFCMIG